MQPSSELIISHNDIKKFGKWSHDVNPLHLDPEAAGRTFFGKPIAHGILTIIESLLAIESNPSTDPTVLEAEFRRPVFPGERYLVQGRSKDQRLEVSLSDDQGVCLQIRLSWNLPPEKDYNKLAWVEDPGSRRDANEGFRENAADLDIEAFEEGTTRSGYYRTGAVPRRYTTGALLSANTVRLLGLCSYIVGMELPGLRSLFTKIRLNILQPGIACERFAYQARVISTNKQFRTMKTDLEVASPDGVLIAAAKLSSYIRFSPSKTDFKRLASVAEPHRDRLEGKVALVCGGSRGLGADMAAALALAGCHVFASHRSATKKLAEFAESLARHDGNVTFLQGDAGDAAWCQSALDTITGRHGKLDFLILNACAPPAPLALTASAATAFTNYVSRNLLLFQQPLTTFLPLLEKSGGLVTAISSSFVEEMPKGFAHYVTLKQAVEATAHTAAKEFANVAFLVPRPPRLQTSWNDTPSGIMGAIPVTRAARAIVDAMAAGGRPGKVKLVSDFPPLRQDTDVTLPRPADLTFVVAASFTVDPLLPGLQFWLKELGHNAKADIAPYGQVLQELVNPTSALSGNQRGIGVVLLRISDWLRELAEEKLQSSEYVRDYLKKTAKEFLRAMRTHRSHAKVETLLVICPSAEMASDGLNRLLDATETDLVAGLKALPGLETAIARDFHSRYGVLDHQIHDPLREKIGHIPYHKAYFHILATIIMRRIQRRLVPLRKVVIVDCDNTLWDGVVGEVGAEGLVFNEAQIELHALLTKLSESGIVICLCSKNEEFDVWGVFDNRPDFNLARDRIVAAMINWRPKSENIRQLAAKLNLGLDSFVFIDDNPVECAEVQAACPQVLTLQWPHDVQRAKQLLRHIWELDVKEGTREDAKRTQMYREEFKRQELLDDNLSFGDFIKSLDLKVDLRSLNEEDLPRASQLTMRTNQFNFTTIRRKESELKPLMENAAYNCGTIRVHDRFGDYGLVGLFIANIQQDTLALDTFLLSCRILGRGVEHHLMAELGRTALAHGATSVKMYVDPTPRNTPAREFLKSITPEEFGQADETGRFTCEIPATNLADIEFQPDDRSTEKPENDKNDNEKKTDSKAEDDHERMRSRESQIERAAYELSTTEALAEAIDGPGTRQGLPKASSTPVDQPEEVRRYIYDVFSEELGLSAARIKEVDELAPLGCDSFKIVEITVALIERFPWLPITLLFEHRSVSDIADHIVNLVRTGKDEMGFASPAAGQVMDQQPTVKATRDIAVVGMDVRCAGADTPEELWALLSQGKTAIGTASVDREFFLYPLNDNRPHWAGLMDEVDGFDADFFGIAPREAELMDPQIRLFLEVAWGALEDAGLVEKVRHLDVGVYAGKMYDDYVFTANRESASDMSPYRSWESFSMANRLSHFLHLQGPSFTVNTACSSSGTALHLACKAIQDGECGVAIVGGSNLILDPERFSQLGRLGILSPSGKCHPFGDQADGTLLGEGIGVVVLKALDTALEDNDRIHGIIKGSALSTGTGTVGFTVPNPNAQALAIRKSLAAAGVDPRTISYVETHGTGTQLGDPIEVRGLMMAYADKQLWDDTIEGPQQCRIGSVKPNTGHLESGACIMGLIKVLLQFRHGSLAPTITSENPNPQIPFNLGPFKIQTRLEPWHPPEMRINGDHVPIPRRAGLSSFGVGGANAHLILEEPPASAGDDRRRHADGSACTSQHILTLSARHADTLKAQMKRLGQHLQDRPDLHIADVCYTTNTARAHLNQRLALVVCNRRQLLEATESYAGGKTPMGCFSGAVGRSTEAPKIAFLFTGQGSQHPGMGRMLYDAYPVFKEALDRCTSILEGLIQEPLLDILFAEKNEPRAERLHQTGFTQPALFALEYAVCQLWRSWGVRPDFVMGHSAGEIVALTVAGVLMLEDGLKLIATRGQLMQALPAGGKMAAIRADEARVLSELSEMKDRVSIAALNGPQHTVISGDGPAVDELAARFEAEGTEATLLKVSHAFHSPLIEPMLAEYKTVYQNLRLHVPSVPVVSCVDGNIIDPSVEMSRYWEDQVRRPVRFMGAMAELDRQGTTVYLEVGPHPVLLGMGSLCLPYEDRIWLPSLRRNADGTATILESLAKLYVRGCTVDWENFNRSSAPKKVGLPTYPFRHRRYWINRPSAASVAERTTLPAGPYSSSIYDIEWQALDPVSSQDHHSPEEGEWLIFADKQGAGAALSQTLAAGGASSILVHATDTYGENEDGSFGLPPDQTAYKRLCQDISESGRTIRGVVHLWSLDLPETDALTVDNLSRARQAVLNSAMHLTQAIAASDQAHRIRIGFVTRGAVKTSEEFAGAAISLSQVPIWGFGRVMALEHPELFGGLVDLPPGGTEVDSSIPALFSALMSRDNEDQVALRNGNRLAPRLRRRKLKPQTAFSAAAEGRYLVVGGNGALGLRLVRWLVEKGARHLTITGRRAEPSKALAVLLNDWSRQGVDAEYRSVDVSSQQAMNALLAHIKSMPNALKGVAHLAGIDNRTDILEMTEREWERVTAPKLEGAWLLHELTREEKLDFFIAFSSIASVLGSDGRAHYAAANAFLDGLGHYRRQMGLPATVINWGPWKEGGMASEEDLTFYHKMGNNGLDPHSALTALEHVLSAGEVQTIIADIDWPRFRSVYAARKPRPIISELEIATETEVADEGEKALPVWRKNLLEEPIEERIKRLNDMLQESVARILGFEDPEDISNDLGFTEMGMDSLRAVEFSIEIQKNLGMEESIAFYDFPNIAVLAKSLIEKSGLSSPLEMQPPSPDKENIIGYSPDIVPEVLDFYRTAWPNRPADTIESRWRWMFIDSAKRLAVPPQMWIYREASSVVGFTGAIPVKLKIGKEEVNTAWCVDTMVLESCRRAGLGPNIMVQAKKDLPFSLSLGQTKEMRLILGKLGWQQVSALQTYVYPIHPQRMLRGKLNPVLAGPVGTGIQLRQYAKRIQSTGKIRHFDINEIKHFEIRHDRLWEEVKQYYTCAVVRDSSYLNWKYVDQPGQDFTRMEFIANGKAEAVAVLMLREPGPNSPYLYRRALILEIIVAPSDSTAILSVLEQIRQKCVQLDVDSIVFEIINDKLEQVLELYGFIKRKPTRFLWLCTDDENVKRNEIINDGKNWLITKGDSDVDRPENTDNPSQHF